MKAVTGTFSIKHKEIFYSAHFERDGWIAGEFVQYLDGLYRSDAVEAEILKLLGYTMRISEEAPPRTADHWIELDIAARILITNSELIKKAVNQEAPKEEEPYWEPVLKRIYSVLNARDFTVKLLP